MQQQIQGGNNNVQQPQQVQQQMQGGNNNNNAQPQHQAGVNAQNNNNVNEECPICLQPYVNGTRWTTLCGHVLCITCVHDFIDRAIGRCFICRNNIRYEECHQVYP